jgi:hypothetical protein
VALRQSHKNGNAISPTHARVIRDTIVVRGSAAAGRASILQAIAIVLGLGAVGLLAATWRLLSLLGAHAA